MIPLVSMVKEMKAQKDIIVAVADETMNGTGRSSPTPWGR